jgi:hypothetical protein
MGKIYANAQGAILRLLQSAQEEAEFGAPSGAAFTLDFDEETNAAFLAGFGADSAAYTMPSGVLKRNGVNVLLAPDGQRYSARKQLAAAKQTIQSNAANLQAYHDLASPNNAQTVAALKLVIEDMQAITTILRALIREAN